MAGAALTFLRLASVAGEIIIIVVVTVFCLALGASNVFDVAGLLLVRGYGLEQFLEQRKQSEWP